ncbi:MAG: VanZ family protein [Bryobacteraceae bacterium]|jgi:VanZ family protein
MTKTDTNSAFFFPLLWILAMAATITGELLPGYSAPMRWVAATHIGDKTLHFMAYALLAFIPVLGFRLRRGIPLALSMILLGVALEFAQRLVPSRSFEIADMVTNALGVLSGIALALAGRAFRPIMEP